MPFSDFIRQRPNRGPALTQLRQKGLVFLVRPVGKHQAADSIPGKVPPDQIRSEVVRMLMSKDQILGVPPGILPFSHLRQHRIRQPVEGIRTGILQNIR